MHKLKDIKNCPFCNGYISDHPYRNDYFICNHDSMCFLLNSSNQYNDSYLITLIPKTGEYIKAWNRRDCIEEDNQIDTAAVMPKRVGTRKGKIVKARVANIRDMTPKIKIDKFWEDEAKEMKDFEDDWIDTAAWTPKKTGSCKIHIKERKKFVAPTLPDEFTDEEPEDEDN